MSRIANYVKKYFFHPIKLFWAVIIVVINSEFGRLLSDKAYIKIAYRANLGKKIDLKNPKSFNEKIQWLKLNDRKPIYTTMVDKYEAKKYVSKLIGEEYIIENYGVWESFSDIDFEKLPEQFVLKCTHDSGGLVICRDKSKLDIEKAEKKINSCLKNNYFYSGREWPYKDVKPRIIAEKYMVDESGDGLRDYKFFCFDGEPKFLYISEGLENHLTARISFLNIDWSFESFSRSDYKPFEVLPQKPEKYDEMLEICRKLTKGTSFLRCDLYEADGKVYFSELTFSPCSGLTPFNPMSADDELGKYIKLPTV